MIAKGTVPFIKSIERMLCDFPFVCNIISAINFDMIVEAKVNVHYTSVEYEFDKW